MLVDINLNQEKLDSVLKSVKEENPDCDFNNIPSTIEGLSIKIMDGVYSTKLSFDTTITLFSDNEIKDYLTSFSNERYNEKGEFDFKYFRECEENGPHHRENYGVCDNIEQVINEYPELKTSKRKFVITLTPILKSGQYSKDGWRWHKHGKYIGIQESKAEYLHDEPIIEEVLVYHIYEMCN